MNSILRSIIQGRSLRLLTILLAVLIVGKAFHLLEATYGAGHVASALPIISRALAAAETPHPRAGEPKPPQEGKEIKPEQGQKGSALEVPPAPSVPVSEEALLSELRVRRQMIEERESELERKRQLISQAERKLIERAEQLSSLQVKLERLEAVRHEHDEENWKGLVKTYETMRPRDAASIMNDLDLPTTLQVLDRMKESKAGMVLAAMTPDRARVVTMELAQMRNKSVSLPTEKKEP